MFGGAVQPITGALPIAISARELGVRRGYGPGANARYAAVGSDIGVFPVEHLCDAVHAQAVSGL